MDRVPKSVNKILNKNPNISEISEVHLYGDRNLRQIREEHYTNIQPFVFSFLIYISV